jgi:hypothetical protein
MVVKSLMIASAGVFLVLGLIHREVHRSSVPLLCHYTGPERTLLDKFLQRAVRQIVDKERLISSLSAF